MRSLFKPFSLTRQMILNVILIVMVTAIIAGLPGILILRNELTRRAWDMVEQGADSLEIFYTTYQNEFVSFAQMLSHRECVENAALAGNPEQTLEHLYDLLEGTGMEFAVVCSIDRHLIVSTLELPDEGLCQGNEERGFFVLPGEHPQAWVYGAHVHERTELGIGRVITGVPVEMMMDEAGFLSHDLKYSILKDNFPIYTSLSPLPGYLEAVFASLPVESASQPSFQRLFTLNDEPYYAVNRPLVNSPSLRFEVALSVADNAVSQKQLLLTLAGGIMIVIAAGSLVGIVISRRISRPLDELVDTAVTFSGGDLSTPVVVRSDVREVAAVSQALENARQKLGQVMSELNNEKAWTDHLLESIVEGIVTLDAEHRITFFSHGAERITGLQREQVMGQSCDDVFRLAEVESCFSEVIPSNGKESRVMVKLPNRGWATLAFTGALLSKADSEQTETALVFRDVSDEAIIHRRLGQFIANVTHEFRTPLAALAASIELLLDQAPHIAPQDLKDLLGSLHLSVLRLQTMIDNLIESASIESGHFRVSPHPTELVKIIHDTVELMTPLFEKYGQHLSVDLPAQLPLVMADAKRTMQVLVNLLSNANKFSPADTLVCLHVGVKDGEVRITVTDQGPGIPVEQYGSLFHRLSRLSAEDGNPRGGAGLGLSVVKAIVEAQGGCIGVEENPGGGARFWFTIKTAGEA
jgi:PAS domain S-box-containing protein